MRFLLTVVVAVFVAEAATAQEPISAYRSAAMKKDYGAQRNVAYCLRTAECPGSSTPKPIEACAWQLVILASGHPEVDSSDVANRRRDCGSLEPDEAYAARRQADELFRKTYGRPLPS